MIYGVMVYVSDGKKVLMVEKGKRENDPNSGFYTPPGGKLRDDEIKRKTGRLEAAIREVKEETGLDIFSPYFVGTILFDNKDRAFSDWKNPKDFFVYVFRANKYSGELNESEEGKPKWVLQNELEKLPKNPGDKKLHEWINDGRNFSGVIKHKGGELDKENTFVDFFEKVY